MRVKGQISLLFQQFWGDVFCHKSCTVHYIVNMISKAGADVVRTITSLLPSFYAPWLLSKISV